LKKSVNNPRICYNNLTSNNPKPVGGITNPKGEFEIEVKPYI
jgi:hypothetical protein